MTIGKDRNKDQLENWQLCGVWKLPFCGHRAIKFTQNCVSFTNPCINLLGLRFPTHVNTTPRYLNVSTCWSVLPLTCRIHYLGFAKRQEYYLDIFNTNFHSGSVARSRKPIECMLKTVEKMLAVLNRLQKVNGWSCSSRMWHPRQLGCDCLSNSCRPVILKPGSEGRIQLPSTLRAALSSLSIKRLIFCETDFVLL